MHTSSTTVQSTGTPEGCVLRLMLLMYDYHASSSSIRIIKFPDDTTVVGLSSNNNETAYREEVDLIAARCKTNIFFCIF